MSSRRALLGTGLAFAALAAGVGGLPRIALAANSQILADVQKRGTIRIATVAGNPPYSAFKPDGQPEGYDVEIGNQLAAALKVKPEWLIVDSPGRITALQTGKADASVADFTATVERSTAVAFTRPYLIVGTNFLVKKDSPLKTVEDANKPGIKVGTIRGGTSEDVVAHVTPKATAMKFNTADDVFLALRSGQVDAQAMDSLQDAAFLAKSGANYRNLPGNWSYEEICIGVPAGDADWLRIVDTFVRQLVGSGEDARLFKKYFGYDMPPLT